MLPSDPKERKLYPIFSGFLMYFPRTCAALSRLAVQGNDQHNPGAPLHWDRDKSSDHPDCLVRHLLQSGTVDDDGARHTLKMAWRAMAMSELELEREEMGASREL